MMNDETVHVPEQQERSHPMVFVIDDDVSTGNLLVHVLMQEASCLAFLFTEGSDVLKAVETMKPHLFLLDYHLPDINGLALYDRLHALPTIESTPAILFSAGSVPENEVQKRHLLFIQKPFDLDELIGTVERTLN